MVCKNRAIYGFLGPSWVLINMPPRNTATSEGVSFFIGRGVKLETNSHPLVVMRGHCKLQRKSRMPNRMGYTYLRISYLPRALAPVQYATTARGLSMDAEYEFRRDGDRVVLPSM